MVKKQSQSLIPVDQIEKSILLIPGEKVMLDFDLADLYGVETRVLVQAVKRNIERFPADFMFQLSREELEDWRSQIVISKPSAKMGLRRRPYVFTEHGVVMLSSVLRSKRAVQVNIEIVRAFVRLRRLLSSHKALAGKLAALEKRYDAPSAFMRPKMNEGVRLGLADRTGKPGRAVTESEGRGSVSLTNNNEYQREAGE